MLVKINIVMIPGINDSHIPDIVKKVKELGVYIVNILPLIPVAGTKFENLRAPTPEERKALMDLCADDVKMMRHCKQCRADAIGLLADDRSSEFVLGDECGSVCGSGTKGPNVVFDEQTAAEETLVAVATSDGKKVDSGFGNARMFRVYASDGKTVRFIKDVKSPEGVPVAGEAAEIGRASCRERV